MIAKKLAKIFCSGFGMGYVPKIPGTFASLIILYPVWFLKENFDLSFLIFLIIIYSSISFYFINIIIKEEKNKDPSFIIVDEHIGQAIALIFCQESFNDYIISFILLFSYKNSLAFEFSFTKILTCAFSFFEIASINGRNITISPIPILFCITNTFILNYRFF